MLKQEIMKLIRQGNTPVGYYSRPTETNLNKYGITGSGKLEVIKMVR